MNFDAVLRLVAALSIGAYWAIAGMGLAIGGPVAFVVLMMEGR